MKNREPLYLWPDTDHYEPPKPHWIDTTPEAWPSSPEPVREEEPEGNFFLGLVWGIPLAALLDGAIFAVVYFFINH